tara:strand:+ start:4172 stop:4516 length:345 start_codon:yes stop_codon:yes gene_type:complete
MNLKEAMKLATPGPLSVSAKRDTHYDLYGRGMTIGSLLSCVDEAQVSENVFANKIAEAKANAALLAHWYNHGPELLSHLKSIIAAIRMNEDMGNWYEDVEPAEEVIAKCEEVEL